MLRNFKILALLALGISAQAALACDTGLNFDANTCASEIVDVITSATLKSPNDEALKRCFADCIAANEGPGPELRACVARCQSRYGKN